MWFTHTLRVRYQETDRMGVVYHTNYINWFEWARSELIRSCGYPYDEVEKHGLLLPVLEVNASFKQPAQYDELVTVYVRVTACTGVRLEFDYEIRRGEAAQLGAQQAVIPAGDLLATGWSKHMWVKRDWKPVRLERQLPELHVLLQGMFGGITEKPG